MDITSRSSIYSPLAHHDSFRLFCLAPSIDHAAPLQGILLDTTLSEFEADLISSYTALSYVWGDQSQTSSIAIDGKETVITASLASALRDIRDTSRVANIWADALCINQEDIPERNRQVALMGRIYSAATHTVIYLGALTPEAETVLHSVRRRGSAIMNQKAEHKEIVSMAKRSILSRPWFTRVWILQELVLSADPWIQLGDVRLRWIDFCAFLLSPGPVAPSGYGLEESDDEMDPKSSDPAIEMLKMMNKARSQHESRCLFDLLRARRGMGASDPRDVVYAHLGVASSADGWSRNVCIDYNQPLAHVYTSAARYILSLFPVGGRADGIDVLMDCLEDVDLDTERQGLPSWVPDWT
ncbi:heterokaryon incompatibility protein-domain-containing protein, partial [Cercophora scortea]